MRSALARCTRAIAASCQHRGFKVGTLEGPAQIASLQDTRAIVRLGGAEVLDFLQGIVTNDVQTLAAEDAPPVYTLLLTPQGRLLHDFFLFRAPGPQPVLLADIHQGQQADLIQALKRYCLRKQVEIDDVSDEYVPWVKFGLDQLLDSTWSTDPRLVELGKRAIKKRADKLDESSPHVQVTTPEHFRQWRFVYGVAEGADELPQGHAVPLEYNMDGLHALNFTKGCYVGQELIARAHYQGTVRKRMMPAAVEALDSRVVVKDADVIDQESGKKVGKIVSVDNSRRNVLALLRITPALQAITGHGTLHIAGSTVVIKPWIPTWWHTGWTHGDSDL